MLLIIAAALMLQGAQAPAYSGVDRQLAVRPPRIDTAVTVDGVLDEPAWGRAARLTGFSQFQPVDGRAAEEPTEVLVWYSATAIHFGIRAREAHGDELIRASRADRDNIGNDDHVQLLIDTYNSRRLAFLFGVNPFGVQQDGTRSDEFSGGAGGGSGAGGGGGFNPLDGNVDLNPDFLFDSRGRLVPGGYEVEIRIPFKSLRYQSGDVQTWGFNVLRRVRHTGYQDSWTPAVRASSGFLVQSGTLEGLTGMRRGLVLELTPTLTSRVQGYRPATDWQYRDTTEAGLNARWGITQNLSLDAAINPDFSQVESDVGQLALNERFELFFPEKRPFFLEGLELFDTPNRLIYTRRIGDPDAGLKLAGRVGSTNVGTLLAVDNERRSTTGDHPVFGVARLRTDLTRRAALGLVGTTREDGAAFSRLAGADARLFHGGLYFIEAQAVRSWRRDAAAGRNGTLYQVMWDRTGRRWGFNYGLNAVSPGFEAAAGFVNRTNVANAHIFNRLSFYGSRGRLVESFTIFGGFNRTWDWTGFRLSRPREGSENGFSIIALRGGWNLNVAGGRNFYHVDPAPYQGYTSLIVGQTGFVRVPYVPQEEFTNQIGMSVDVTTPTYRYVTASAGMTSGSTPLFAEASEGKLFEISGSMDFRPTPKVRVGLSYVRALLTRDRDGSQFSTENIPRLKVEYQASRSVFFRFVGQYAARERDALYDAQGRQLYLDTSGAGTPVPFDPLTANDLRVDWLFSYRPTPGTLVYFGYGASLTEPDAFRFNRDQLRRTSDGFFAKVSYVFRL